MMETVGQIIRAKWNSLGLLLRQVAAYLNIDQATLSIGFNFKTDLETR